MVRSSAAPLHPERRTTCADGRQRYSRQMDESFHGGKPKNMHRSRRLKLQIGENGYAEKTAVFGMLDTGTRQVRAMVVPNVKRSTLQNAILEQRRLRFHGLH